MTEKNLTRKDLVKLFEIKVFIIESPKPEDFLNGTEEGSAIYRALTLTGTDVEYFKVVNRKCLKQVLKKISSSEPSAADKIILPIIHFSLHGNSDKIALTSNETLTWTELAKLLKPVNQSLNEIVTICMSSCEGANAHKMAHVISNPPPYYTLVGPKHKIAWGDTLTAFITFYNSLVKFIEISEGIKRMNLCIGSSDEFQLFTGEEEKEKSLEKIREIARRIRKQMNINKETI